MVLILAAGLLAATPAMAAGCTVSSGVFQGSSYVFGTKFADTIDCSSVTTTISVFGLDGNDTITGGTGTTLLSGGPGADNITGLGGNDSINGGPETTSWWVGTV